jgi:C-terminal processing protease CtpA/Prc
VYSGWKDVNKSPSWVFYFALSLSNTPIISFAREHNLLDKMPFQHIVHCCKARTPVDAVKIYRASASSTSNKYKFGVQVPRGIKNAIQLDTKNGNNLWQEAIKTELKHLTDYHTFIVLDSVEAVSSGYQKITYHIVFDVKLDLRHKARLVA